MAPFLRGTSAREPQGPSQKSAFQRGGDPASSTLSFRLHALAHGAQRRDDALDSSQLAVLEMPVEVLELREIVGIANVFGGEPRLQTARELDDLARLKIFHAAQKRKHLVDRRQSIGMAAHGDQSGDGFRSSKSKARSRARSTKACVMSPLRM